ncbi:MAG: ABC transporter substrate-binding protein [Candidatus Bipolaricaulaceae bacterium]
MRRTAMWLVGLAMLVGVSALAAPPQDTLVMGARTDIIVDLDPARTYEVFTNLVIEQYYDALVNITVVGGEVVAEPGLAESWEVSEDGLTWTFHLRRGAKFHSGNEVTADAVVYSFHRSLALDFAPIWILSQYVPEPEMIQKVGDYSVAITTTDPVAELIIASVVGFQGICSIVDPAVVKAHATADDPWANQWLKENDAGSGPFILRQWSPNERITLERFDDYWRGPAGVKRFIIQDIPEPAAQKLALDKGDIDIAWDLLPEQVDMYRGDPDFKVIEAPGWGIEYLSVNAGKPPFDNEMVRDAIRWAVDYDAIINGIQQGAAVPGQTIIPAGMFGHLPATPYYKDTERAKALLAAAGYPDGFEVEILSSTHPRRVAIATQVQADLAEIGIEVNITQMVSAQFYELYRAQKHDFLVAGWGVDYADPDALAKPFAHCCTTGPEAIVRQLAWRNMYADCDTTFMVEAAAKELDADKRRAMYEEIQRRVLDKGPYIILYYPLNQANARAVVEGLQLAPMESFTEFWGVTKTG